MTIKDSFKNSISFRIIIIGILLLVFMIPVSMIKSIIYERENRSQEVTKDISNQWASSQELRGPVLMVPYDEYRKVSEKNGKNTVEKIEKIRTYAYFLPSKLTINAKIVPEIRYRNIYKAIVYKGDFDISGNFDISDFKKWDIKTKDIKLNKAKIFFGISDTRGIKDQVSLNFNNSKKFFEAGISTTLNKIIKNGIQSNVKASWDNSFKFNLKLNGSTKISFAPFGKTTDVSIYSNWNAPNFIGSFLPDKRTITKKDFKATWHVLDLNRGYPQSYKGDEMQALNKFEQENYGYRGPKIYVVKQTTKQASFGVEFNKMNDYYQKSERSVKYAILFLVLTFLIFFFVEIFNKKRIHPLSYILVGLSLSLFFILLLSISEYLGFNYAYIIASIATIGAITLYAKNIFKSSRFTLMLFGLLGLLYMFIFILLQLEGYALLIGSIVLFIVLSAVMYISRDIDWYAINDEQH